MQLWDTESYHDSETKQGLSETTLALVEIWLRDDFLLHCAIIFSNTHPMNLLKENVL